MGRHIRIATAAIALSLLLAPHPVLAQDKPDTDNAAAKEDDPHAQLESMAKEAYLSMKAARAYCDVAGFVAARARLSGAIAAMRQSAKAARKLGSWSRLNPTLLDQRAQVYQLLFDLVDGESWERCPSTAQGGHASLPPAGGSKSAPPDWAIALAGQQAGASDGEFDGPSRGSFDGIAMIDRALHAARPGMDDGHYPGGADAAERPTMDRVDPRIPFGFAREMASGARVPGFGGWGWQRKSMPKTRGEI